MHKWRTITFIHISSDGNGLVFRADREQIYVEEKAFVKANLMVSFEHPVQQQRWTLTFKIEEIFSDSKLGICYEIFHCPFSHNPTRKTAFAFFSDGIYAFLPTNVLASLVG